MAFKDNVMRPLARCLPAVAVAALLAAPACAQQLYKSIGPDGRVQYSDRPPVSGQKAEKITASRVGSSSSGTAAAAADAAKAKSGGPKTAAEQEQAFRQRQIEAEEKAKKDEKLAQDNRAKEESCAGARRELAGLQSGGRAARVNEQGERVFLEDDQVQQEIGRLQREIAGGCK
jgi:Skp family chaperone for outer membrane proteins